ncbi:hypothetical protein cce_0959 [Crocosphaera subtropica ATCC 51142]|uniref:Uncharacterized protein n=1 Tax=Crocosphaera subtropica (strain ATCC 51142 / BH68) TaxID=43989 RepID=B1WSY0_CROS5|nr:protealysin inhibitor emfourin [Crocosphaera subtropica]ACB50310.1 hypothetical protein cce_0959 [Crocosphaera subtropica ATCC 51142]
MKITFRQSGGFAGLIRGCEIDTANLSESEAAYLKGLVEQSHILEATSQLTLKARDLYKYEVIIESEKGTVRASFDDMTWPETAQKLLAYLQEHSKPQPFR